MALAHSTMLQQRFAARGGVLQQRLGVPPANTVSRHQAAQRASGPAAGSSAVQEKPSSSSSSSSHEHVARRREQHRREQERDALLSGVGVELGPIGLTIGKSAPANPAVEQDDASSMANAPPLQSIHSMTTAEWRAKFERDGMVDLWVEEEFNAGSRLVGGRVAHFGGVSGFMTGEGPSAGEAPVHRVTIHNHHQGCVMELDVPEDRYVLYSAEDEGLQLPYACRMGCCTACAVKVLEGEMWQPEALGISRELKEQGYALMCVGFPTSDLVIETVTEDEVYDLQFARIFAEQALDPNNPEHIERDDFALSAANMDE